VKDWFLLCPGIEIIVDFIGNFFLVLPAYREKLVTLRKTEELPTTKARKSVREVMVMPIPAVRMVQPMIEGTWSTVCSSSLVGILSLHADISRNISSTPMPGIIRKVDQIM
jgi:hypothetical protein